MTIQSKARALRNRISRVFAGEAGRRHAAVGPAHQWKMKRRFQIDFLKTHGLMRDHRLIDIGCGTLRGGIPLIKLLDQGHYTGIEVREDVLELGRDELREAGLEHKEPNLVHCTGLSTLDLEYKAEYIWAFAVLIHMDDDALNGCLSFVSKHLVQGGAFYGNVNIGEGGESHWQGFPVVKRTMRWYEQTAERFGLVPTDTGSLLELGHDDGRPEPQSRRMLKFTHIEPNQAS
jgi:SAM-dependent methyltransferase